MPEAPQTTYPWAQKLVKLVQAGATNQFVLYGNVYDIIPNNGRALNMREYVFQLFRSQFSPVLFYDRSDGFSFGTPKMEEQFRKLLATEGDQELPVAQPEPPAPARGRVGAASVGGGRPQPRRGPESDAPVGPNREPEKKVPLPTAPPAALTLIEEALWGAAASETARRPMLCVLDYADSLVPQGDSSAGSRDGDRDLVVRLLRWSRQREFNEAGHIVILLTPHVEDISAQLRKGNLVAIEVPLPSVEERANYINTHVVSARGTRLEVAPGQFATLSAGLNYQQIRALSAEARVDNQPITASRIKDAKRTILSQQYAGLIEVIEPRFGLEAIGGLNTIKEFCTEVCQAIERGDTKLVPQGLMLMGPPGTGKSALVEALAFHAGFNFVRILDPRSMWVGESERRLSAALAIIRAMVPVIVLEDEADQSEQSRDEYNGDSGVSSRLRQKRFEFTADPELRGKVLWVRITNRPDKVDPADKRSGRSSERIPMLMPDDGEKKAIFEVMPRKHGFETNITNMTPLITAVNTAYNNRVSGADIEEISLRAYRHARQSRREMVAVEDYLWAINDFIPLHSQEQIDRMERMALDECSSRRFLPGRPTVLNPEPAVEPDMSAAN
jgi:transitional endoplasmic reticulum ATPase